MSDITPLRRWLPLSDAVKQISERLGVPTEDARRALINALRDEITQARGDFWEGSSDRVFLQDIDLAMLLNEDIDWEKDKIDFNEPMQFSQISGGQFFAIYNIEVYRDNFDEWLKAHRSREPAKSHDKGTDVVGEAASTTRPTSPTRRGGGPKPGPYLRHLHKFLDNQNKRDPAYFTSKIVAIADDVRKRFKIDDPHNRRGLPKRSGLEAKIRQWMHKNIPPE